MSLSATCTCRPKLGPGVLTQAYGAHLNSEATFPGLSIFEGEHLSTEPDGKMGVRVAASSLVLSGSTGATLHQINGGDARGYEPRRPLFCFD